MRWTWTCTSGSLPELYLKRAVVGGIEQVFEINRSFRNEGVDSSHSPEFATLEAYEAYSDYNGMAELTQTLVQEATVAIHGSTVAVHADGTSSTRWDMAGHHVVRRAVPGSR